MKITAALLKKIAPRAKQSVIEPVADALTEWMPHADINTLFRAAHFLAQAAHETDQFRTLHEYWGPTPAQRRYEGRADLGNSQPGDGYRYRGRGIFQLTGRFNYRQIGEALKLDLENNPALAAEAAVSVQIACYYWKVRDLNKLADADDVREITKKINGGTNGLQERIDCLLRAKKALNELPG